MEFYSNGKLLLTGEYLVMEGARALALPVRFGQKFVVNENQKDFLKWESFDIKGKWFEAVFDSDLNILFASSVEIAGTLTNILKQIAERDKHFWDKISHKYVRTELNYDRKWGLGSSATLVANLSGWFDVDPYEILEANFGGSGYDIACALGAGPLIYQLKPGQRIIQDTGLPRIFKDHAFFIYSGRKQNSAREVAKFKKNRSYGQDQIKEVDEISIQMLNETTYPGLLELIQRHEWIMGQVLNTIPVKKRWFQDFDGEIKSLGAWGGDFMLVVTNRPFAYVKSYFDEKGLNIVFRYEEMALA